MLGLARHTWAQNMDRRSNAKNKTDRILVSSSKQIVFLKWGRILHGDQQKTKTQPPKFHWTNDTEETFQRWWSNCSLAIFFKQLSYFVKVVIAIRNTLACLKENRAQQHHQKQLYLHISKKTGTAFTALSKTVSSVKLRFW